MKIVNEQKLEDANEACDSLLKELHKRATSGFRSYSVTGAPLKPLVIQLLQQRGFEVKFLEVDEENYEPEDFESLETVTTKISF